VVGSKQRVGWLLERRGGWCFVRVVFLIVAAVNSVGGGENNFWPQHDGERNDCTCHFNARIEGIFGWQGGQECHRTF